MRANDETIRSARVYVFSRVAILFVVCVRIDLPLCAHVAHVHVHAPDTFGFLECAIPTLARIAAN